MMSKKKGRTTSKKAKTIRKRQSSVQSRLLRAVEEVGILEIACKKAGIGRSTVYRWKQSDSDFSSELEDALWRGRHRVTDMAESALIKKIQEGNVQGIVFWLKAHSARYGMSNTNPYHVQRAQEERVVEDDAISYKLPAFLKQLRKWSLQDKGVKVDDEDIR